MKLFGTVYPFIETEDQDYKLGRHVANFQFLRALLTYGTFDEYHLFCLNTTHYATTKNKLLSSDIPNDKKEKVRLFLINSLIDTIKANEYHVFHLGGWGYFLAGLTYIRNKHGRNKFPITGVIHSLIETRYDAFKVCNAPLLPYDTIICTSKAGRQVLANVFSSISGGFDEKSGIRYKGGFETIPLGTEDSLLVKDDCKQARSRLGIRQDSIVLLTIGRLSPQTKGDLYPLLQCFSRLVKHHEDKKLLLVAAGGGTPQQVQMIQNMNRELNITNTCRIMPNIDDQTKRLLFTSSDIYVSAIDNLQETFGLSVIEAMACGCPAVVSDFDGYKDLVEDGIQGFRVPTMWTDSFDICELADIMNLDTIQLMLSQCTAIDTEAMFSILDKLILDPKLRSRLGEQARARVAELFCWSKVIQQYEKLWDRLAQEAASYKGPIVTPVNMFMNDYIKDFSHYPSSLLTRDSICSITETGKAALSSGAIPMPYSDIGPLLDMKAIAGILSALASSSLTAGALEAGVLKALPSSIARYTILWAAKYSLIHLENHPIAV